MAAFGGFHRGTERQRHGGECAGRCLSGGSGWSSSQLGLSSPSPVLCVVDRPGGGLSGWLATASPVAPSPPTPLPRFTGARGGLCFQLPVWGVQLRGFAWGKPLRSAEGGVAGISPFNFLASSLYGREAMPPHPRPLCPVSRGRGEDFVFSCQFGAFNFASSRGGGQVRCPAGSASRGRW